MLPALFYCLSQGGICSCAFQGLDCEITFSGVKFWKSFPIPLILASTKATVVLISCLAVVGPLEQCKIELQISVRTGLCVVNFQRDAFSSCQKCRQKEAIVSVLSFAREWVSSSLLSPKDRFNIPSLRCSALATCFLWV